MGPLAEYLRQEDQRLKSEWPGREQAAAEWKNALSDILNQVEQWVRESDPARLLRVHRDTVPHYELRLGNCDLPRLTVVYEASQVIFQPKPRFSLALTVDEAEGKGRRADGYISVLCPEPSGYYLFRLLDGGQSRWFLMSTYPGRKQKPDSVVFTREVAESLLVGLLK